MQAIVPPVQCDLCDSEHLQATIESETKATATARTFLNKKMLHRVSKSLGY